MRSSKATGRALESLERHRTGDIGDARETFCPEEREPANRVHRLGAVEQGETFLGPEIRRLKPGFLQRVRARHALALEKRFPFPEQRKRKMRQRREISARPDRALLGNDRADFVFSISDEELDDLQPNPAEAKSEDVGTEQHHRAHFRLRERTADAAGMTAHEVDLELLQFVGGNVNVGQFSEAGADTVDDWRAARRSPRPRCAKH